MDAPRVLLIGAGRFGTHHLYELQRLETEGQIVLAGVVVESEKSRDTLRARLDRPVFAGFDTAYLADVDAVDIVTPAASHAALVEACLPHAHVLVEKPLATTSAQCRSLSARAAELGRVLMVGHLFRYQPTVQRLKAMATALETRPRAIFGQMINPWEERVPRYDANLEFLHLFDIIDFIFGLEPEICRGARRQALNQISLRYPGPMHAVLEIGWVEAIRRRRLDLLYDDRVIECYLDDNLLVTRLGSNQFEKEFLPHRLEALRAELRAFLACAAPPVATALATAPGPGPRPESHGEVATRIVEVAIRSRPRGRPAKPRVAVVGGGVFGAAIAIELGECCDVTVFERHPELMREASYANQWRHHGGFHYPRSFDQIQEIKAARATFEAEYGDTIMRWFPAYFCTSATGIEIPAERYLAACMANDLTYSIEDPPPGIVDPAAISLCLKVDEGVYDFPRLKAAIAKRLAASTGITVALGSEVADAHLETDGSKRLLIRRAQDVRPQRFDYLINASYVNRNLVASWLGFPIEPLRFHFDELLLIRLPAAQCCVSIIDGPFTSLVGTGEEGLFLLSHALDSSHYAVVTADGLPPGPRSPRSNRENMLRHASAYLPVLEHAQVLESRFAMRAVPAFSPDTDARPTLVTEHGFGCWSVLGGKILTCVSNAREIKDAILAEA